MASAHFVKSSRVEHTCHRGHVIAPPAGYFWAAPGYHARKKFACSEHPFRQSDLTAGLVSQVYAAQEAIEDEFSARDNILTGEDVESAVQDFLTALEEYRDERQTALDAWEYGNSQLQEYVDEAEEAISEVEGWSIEEYPGDLDADGEPTNDDEWHDWLGEQMDAALEVINGLSI